MAKDSDKDKDEITLEEKTGKKENGDVMDKESSEQLEEEQIEEHPEH
ncbi:MAG: hypothetical protein H0X50_10625 [Nitrosopumilus sp.]|nr:hypothetical protein [Nitrosopumilus sp.]